MKAIWKAVTWRIIVIIFSFTIPALFGMPLKKNLLFVLVWNVINMAAYIVHEKLWERK